MVFLSGNYSFHSSISDIAADMYVYSMYQLVSDIPSLNTSNIYI